MLKQLIDRTQFAISTEETRYYLNGIFFHVVGEGGEARLRAVATDGHRLAKAELPAPTGSAGMPGIIVPRKTVGEIQKLLEDPASEVSVSLSDTKIRLTIGDLVLTSKLIDGTFPDYERVIPKANDKVLTLDKAEFERAVDRVSTISADRGPRGEAVACRRQDGARREQSGFRQRHGRAAPSATSPSRSRSASTRNICSTSPAS